MKRAYSSTADALGHAEEPEPKRRIRPLIALRTRKFLHQLTPEQCDPQLHSPLFGKLPAELRNNIFSLVLGPYEYHSRQLKATSVLARKGEQKVRKVNTALLLTCKRAYAEYRTLPLSNTTIQVVDEGYVKLGPGIFSANGALDDFYLQDMARYDLKITHIQYILSPPNFCDIELVEHFSTAYLKQLSPQHITITTLPLYQRYGENIGYRVINAMIAVFKCSDLPPSLKAFTLEVEFTEGQRAIAATILKRLRDYTVELSDGSELQTTGDIVPAESYRDLGRWVLTMSPFYQMEPQEVSVHVLKWVRGACTTGQELVGEIGR